MSAIADATRRGFTEHTMLDNIGLVHMNGRVYDPAIGRFLSADPNIDGAMNTQAWNRYSYVFNNPLSLTDPTGYWSLKNFFKKWLRPIVAITAAALTFGYLAPVASQWFAASLCLAPGTITAAGAALGAASSGAVSTAILGGSPREIIRSAVFASAIAYTSIRFTDWLAARPDKEGFYRGLYQVDPYSADGARMVSELGTVENNSRLGMNGIMNTLQKAAENAIEQTGSESAYFYYNPSHGFGWDLLESAVQKFSPTSRMGTDLADVLAATNGKWSVIAAHSQGSLILSNAVNTLAARGIDIAGSVTISTYGSAANRWLLSRDLRSIGYQARLMGGDHGLDMVGNVVGFNAWNNPFRFAGSIVATPSLFFPFSPHSSYHY